MSLSKLAGVVTFHCLLGLTIEPRGVEITTFPGSFLTMFYCVWTCSQRNNTGKSTTTFWFSYFFIWRIDTHECRICLTLTIPQDCVELSKMAGIRPSDVPGWMLGQVVGIFSIVHIHSSALALSALSLRNLI
jgi:hypothetical protein